MQKYEHTYTHINKKEILLMLLVKLLTKDTSQNSTQTFNRIY